MRIKIKYVVFSLLASAVLTLGNIPAINGIDFYPLGNLNFIPLAILAYGVLRFRLMDIRSILHITFVWAVVSSLVLIPNILLVLYFWSDIIKLNTGSVVPIFIVWFIVNYIYIRRVQPLIDQLFNRRKFDLNQEESRFIENIAHLKTFNELVNEFTDVLQKTLYFTDFRIIRRKEETGKYFLNNDEEFELDKKIESWFLTYNDLVDKSLVEMDPVYSKISNLLFDLFDQLDCEFILPVIQNDQIIGLMTMPERAILKQFSLNEIKFIKNINTSASIALSNSIMYQNLTNYKNNLELMVQERTKELQQAKDVLWGEMELAKKIQTVLLPDKPFINGYEISGYMKTADLVGGDYYDVINVADMDWVVIGDVSGHGVPAGLIMMMVQTSIRSVLSVGGNMRPTELLENVNQVITENIKKLNEDKYMTITVLACFKGGRFYYSGLHQDIMIYRADTDSVEMVETNGIWIGILEDINRLIANEELNLNIDDVMLLYSDGITEAWREGTVRGKRDPSEMYSDERLEKIFKGLGKEHTENIKNGIINSLKGYDCDDDVTLLILKRID